VTRLVLSGFYGMGNAGDEAVLAALVQLFREREPGVGITVLSADPVGTAAFYKVAAVPRMQPGAVLAAVRRSDLFISGGGSLLQDVTSAQSLLYYLGLILLACRAGRPAVVLAQGIGPIRRPAMRRLTGRILRGVQRITVRDAESAAELERLGVGQGGSPPIEVTADPVFALEPASPAAPGSGHPQGVPLQAPGSAEPVFAEGREAVGAPLVGALGGGAAKRLGIAVRPWPGIEAALPVIAAGVRAAMEAGARPILLPLQPDTDTPVCRRLAEAIGVHGAIAPLLLTTVPTPSEWLALVGQLDLLLAMRLHALIFAAAAGVPLLGISYDPKVDSLLARLELQPVGRVDQLDPTLLAARLKAALADPDAERAPAPAVAGLRAAARRNAEVALDAAVPSARPSDPSTASAPNKTLPSRRR
jgi:polysaccharide pyruvyl transferase CsaB